MCRIFSLTVVTVAAVFCWPPVTRVVAQEPETGQTEPTPAKDNKPRPDPPGLVRLSPDHELWIDNKRKFVVVDGNVCLRAGPLEMFACPRHSKEHESIVSLKAPAQFVHAALLGIGAKPGNTVEWDPKYVPASGTEIEIWVLWKDKGGMHRKMRAQEWIRQSSTGKPMPFKWVFAGSSFWRDEETGKEIYQAEGGDLICVSNFSTATLDLPVESTAHGDDLMFEAFTENIPTRGTHVRLVLIPKLDEKAEPAKDKKADKTDDE